MGIDQLTSHESSWASGAFSLNVTTTISMAKISLMPNTCDLIQANRAVVSSRTSVTATGLRWMPGPAGSSCTLS